jgi:GT2 family glycosyltransferase
MTRSSGGESLRPARSPRRGGTPFISAIIASTGTREHLAACLASLAPQCEQASVQLIVIRRPDAIDVSDLEQGYPNVLFLRGPANASIADLRAAAMAEAHGDIVALTTDDVEPRSDWITTLLARSPVSPTSAEANRPSGKARARRSGPSPLVTPSGPHPRVTPT